MTLTNFLLFFPPGTQNKNQHVVAVGRRLLSRCRQNSCCRTSSEAAFLGVVRGGEPTGRQSVLWSSHSTRSPWEQGPCSPSPRERGSYRPASALGDVRKSTIPETVKAAEQRALIERDLDAGPLRSGASPGREPRDLQSCCLQRVDMKGGKAALEGRGEALEARHPCSHRAARACARERARVAHPGTELARALWLSEPSDTLANCQGSPPSPMRKVADPEFPLYCR